jgi:hypothetical protein
MANPYRNLLDGLGLGVLMLIGTAFGMCLAPIPMMGVRSIADFYPTWGFVCGGAVLGGILWKIIRYIEPWESESN